MTPSDTPPPSKIVTAWASRARKWKSGEAVDAGSSGGVGVHLVIRGLLTRSRDLPNGRSATTSVALPGNYEVLSSQRSEAGTWLCSPCASVVASLSVEEFQQGLARCDALAAWGRSAERRRFATLQQHAIMLSRGSALERTGHFLCEMIVRSEAPGPVRKCPFPFNQAQLADVLGLSVVHTNRTLGVLRAASLISVKSGWLATPDFDALARASLFDEAYLEQARD